MSQFIDVARISVRAGRGGNGAVAFHREKYVAAGGPDGGDGGRGGDVILQADPRLSTLMDFRYKRKYTAEDGQPGRGKRCTGKDGASLVIRVPSGTLVRDAETREIIRDRAEGGTFVLAKGGRGGWGNQHFATPTRQVPNFAKSGLPGEAKDVLLELKLLADVGLVGFPNAGKSTLLAAVTQARPKIAGYPFTTLSPNLGVVFVEEGVSFVMADIPGLIEGAAEGAGLGHDFLRHIDRCRLLVQMVDAAGTDARDPVEDFHAIDDELRQYNEALWQRPRILAANKIDAVEDESAVEALRALAEERGYPFFTLSAAGRVGLRELIYAIAEQLSQLPPITVYEPEYVPRPPEVDADGSKLQIRREDDLWLVEGPWLERLIADINFSDYESRNYFDRKLRESGLFERLEEMGIKDGDTVSLYDMEFEYQK